MLEIIYVTVEVHVEDGWSVRFDDEIVRCWNRRVYFRWYKQINIQTIFAEMILLTDSLRQCISRKIRSLMTR